MPIPTKAVRLKPSHDGFTITIDAATVVANRENKENNPVIFVRDGDDEGYVMYRARHVDILGPSNVVHRPEAEAVPGTNGRGICPLMTFAPIIVHIDDPDFVNIFARLK